MWLCWLVQINTYSKSHSVKSSGNRTEREMKIKAVSITFKTEYKMININAPKILGCEFTWKYSNKMSTYEVNVKFMWKF